jgi:transcriptional regulator with XRE-family HTH domain
MPLAAQRAFRALGANIRDARKRRRLTVAIVAERAMIAYGTALKVERGDPGVSIGAFANVLFVLGLADTLGEIGAIQHDEIGQQLASESLPQRVRLTSTRTQRTPRKRDG